jgi:hypothetical protein
MLTRNPREGTNPSRVESAVCQLYSEAFREVGDTMFV